MPRNNSEEERLTEDEIARRKLGPRGVPGGEDSAKMTPHRKRTFRRKGNSTATLRSFGGERAATSGLLMSPYLGSLTAIRPEGRFSCD
jgi:hypothetical protein